MPLEPDARLGAYRVTAALGAGGMGEVWKARDEKLDRDVAIKVLPARLANEPEALARFEREAKAVAALSHPNILAIHDFGQAGGQHYAVMELLDGQTLRDALASGALPPKKAAEYGRQIAEGLAAAHAKGIVHRDLKPENLFVTRDGHVKILDFGLARQNAAAGETSDTNSPTVERGTEPGTVLGTVGYMAPEQVRGRTADHRADIFSFGAVLYEMLTGRRAFGRDTGAETMTAILREEPQPASSVREGVPPALERVVEHCLEKRPEDRFQSARDLAFALGGSSSSSSRSVPEAPAVRKGLPLIAIATGLSLLVGLAAGAWLAGRFATVEGPTRPLEARYLTYSGHDFAPAVSPDGRSLAFRSDRDGRARIWLKQFATNTEVALTDGPMDDAPSFTADGTTVIFTRRTGQRLGLFRVPLLGGEPRRLVDDAESGAVSPDGKQIAFVRSTAAAPGKVGSARLMIVAVDGSGERELARAEGSGILGPSWSPDGSKITVNYSGVGGGSFSMRTVDVATGAMTTTVASSVGSRPWGHQWNPSGALVYSNGQVAAGSLAGTTGRIYRIDPRDGKQTLLFASPDMLGRLALRGGDSLVVESQTVRQNLREWEPAGTSRALTEGRASDRQPIYSPDGQWIVFSSDRSGNLDLWARSTRNGELRPLTDDAAQDWDPAFTPDGRLLWSSNRTGNFEIWTADADGSGARQLSHDGVDAENPAASPDGQWIVYGSTRPGEAGLWRMGSDGSAPKLLLRGLVGIPDVSPDGRHVVCLGFSGNLLRSGPQVIASSDGAPVAFAVDMDQIRVTTANVGRARWLPDGSGLAFVGQDDKGLDGIFAQDFVAGRDTRATRRKLAGFQPGVEAETFAIAADGKHVVVAGREMVSSLVLVEGLDKATAPR